MRKFEDKYWIETDSFVQSSIPIKFDTTKGIKGNSFPYIHAALTRSPPNPSLLCFEVFSHAQTFCSKPKHLDATQYSDLFVTHTNGFIMHIGQPNPRSVINEYISGNLI